MVGSSWHLAASWSVRLTGTTVLPMKMVRRESGQVDNRRGAAYIFVSYQMQAEPRLCPARRLNSEPSARCMRTSRASTLCHGGGLERVSQAIKCAHAWDSKSKGWPPCLCMAAPLLDHWAAFLEWAKRVGECELNPTSRFAIYNFRSNAIGSLAGKISGRLYELEMGPHSGRCSRCSR